jgi:hypothetical protein
VAQRSPWGPMWGSHGCEYEDGRLLGCSALSPAELYRRSRCTEGDHDDGSSKSLWNVGKLTDYTALQPRRQPSSSKSVTNGYNVIFTLIFWNSWTKCRKSRFSLVFIKFRVWASAQRQATNTDQLAFPPHFEENVVMASSGTNSSMSM